jgi:hypothetical protein
MVVYYCCRPKPPSRQLCKGRYLAPRHPVLFFQTNDTLLNLIQAYVKEEQEREALKIAYYWWIYALSRYFSQLRQYQHELKPYQCYEKCLIQESKRHHTTYFIERYKRQKCKLHRLPKRTKGFSLYFCDWSNGLRYILIRDEPKTYERLRAPRLTLQKRPRQTRVHIRE